jgi:hypothetical protein
VRLYLLTQTGFPVTLLENGLLFFGNSVLHSLQLLVEILSPEVRISETILHDGDVFLKSEEIFSEGGQFVLEGSF